MTSPDKCTNLFMIRCSWPTSYTGIHPFLIPAESQQQRANERSMARVGSRAVLARASDSKRPVQYSKGIPEATPAKDLESLSSRHATHARYYHSQRDPNVYPRSITTPAVRMWRGARTCAYPSRSASAGKWIFWHLRSRIPSFGEGSRPDMSEDETLSPERALACCFHIYNLLWSVRREHERAILLERDLVLVVGSVSYASYCKLIGRTVDPPLSVFPDRGKPWGRHCRMGRTRRVRW
jgi:hypothetical protein